MFSKIQEILLAHIAIISDSPTLHLDTKNQNLPVDKDYRIDLTHHQVTPFLLLMDVMLRPKPVPAAS